MIRRCITSDKQKIFDIINEAAKAYDGAIPSDCYHRPYMPENELEREMKRVDFFGWEERGKLVGVMGIEPVKDVTLLRHAYVLPGWQRRGIGERLLEHLEGLVATPRFLVGTWADAGWAIDFYMKHGFTLLPDKDRLLAEYWDIPLRQIETSVVMGKSLL